MGLYLLAGIFAAGLAVGAFRARRRGGSAWDMLQWGFGHGVGFLVLGVVASIILGVLGIGT